MKVIQNTAYIVSEAPDHGVQVGNIYLSFMHLRLVKKKKDLISIFFLWRFYQLLLFLSFKQIPQAQFN